MAGTFSPVAFLLSCDILQPTSLQTITSSQTLTALDIFKNAILAGHHGLVKFSLCIYLVVNSSESQSLPKCKIVSQISCKLEHEREYEHANSMSALYVSYTLAFSYSQV